MNWKFERWDWPFIGSWLALLGFCVTFWATVIVLIAHHV